MRHCKNCDDLVAAMGQAPDNHISKKSLEYRMAGIKTLKWLGWSSPAESMELRQAIASARLADASQLSATVRMQAERDNCLGLLKDAEFQLARLTGENLERYARTYAALCKSTARIILGQSEADNGSNPCPAKVERRLAQPSRQSANLGNVTTVGKAQGSRTGCPS